MTPTTRTMRWAFTTLLAAVGLYEASALWTTEKGDTISEIIWTASDDPTFGKVLVLLIGLTLGHFFWPRKIS